MTIHKYHKVKEDKKDTGIKKLVKDTTKVVEEAKKRLRRGRRPGPGTPVGTRG